MKTIHNKLLLGFYGDDFTGSTDVMETLALNGLPTALFLSAPTQAEVDAFKLKRGVGGMKLRAFGVAGVARSLTPDAMRIELPAIFSAMHTIPTDFIQYKVCSTLDSSPDIGNIGLATDIACQYFPSDKIPILIGAPFLNRFVVFGNLFARIGDITYRLDRHPVMANHPVTPMRESDIRLHLGLQTDRPFKLIDVHTLDAGYDEVKSHYEDLADSEGNFILFDTMSYDHLDVVAKTLYECWPGKTQFTVASSGLSYGLAKYVRKLESGDTSLKIEYPDIAKRVLVVAGSCSPVTAQQVDHAQSIDFAGIKVNMSALISNAAHELEKVTQEALINVRNGKHVVVYTADGPDDHHIEMVQNALGQKSGKVIGELLAEVTRAVLAAVENVRVVVCGGDTSGYVSRALKISALETLCPIAPGAPLCVAHARDAAFDGLEIALKGGQNGKYDYFERIIDPDKFVDK
ncbi:MAG: four-carbon acid sugar kinase family protein [Saprospiraceae bacterium]|nr:four-carbon acid sugar kinase family protein [Saprospiraceae bacterium]